ncbi:MAG TPA: glycosyltransferase family 1 protein [Flavitalea sp.]|nr:glycosyltransferase family 1 protein [Flavitalea sp.]
MRILYDSQIFRVQKFGGVSRYCAELMHGLKQNKDFQVVPNRFFSNNKHLGLLGLTHHNFIANSQNLPGKRYIEKLIRRKEEKFLLDNIQSGSFDIYHPTYYNPAYLKFLPKDKPLVATIHDMTYELYYDEEFKTVHQESINKKNVIERATHIICPSENTKKDVLNLYPELTADRLSVIHHGSSLPNDIGENNIDLPATYLLYIGKRGKYKNFNWLLKSIAGFLNQKDVSLICAGGKPFSIDEKNLIAELNIRNKVMYQDISNDRDLATMYKRAGCFIYPSSHEGFGIPILEAYSCGCPALLANSSCFPEIGADGALYFENGNAGQLVEQLNRILGDKTLADNLRKKGSARLKDFSWEKTVQQHIEVYKKVLSN